MCEPAFGCGTLGFGFSRKKLRDDVVGKHNQARCWCPPWLVSSVDKSQKGLLPEVNETWDFTGGLRVWREKGRTEAFADRGSPMVPSSTLKG